MRLDHVFKLRFVERVLFPFDIRAIDAHHHVENVLDECVFLRQVWHCTKGFRFVYAKNHEKCLSSLGTTSEILQLIARHSAFFCADALKFRKQVVIGNKRSENHPFGNKRHVCLENSPRRVIAYVRSAR